MIASATINSHEGTAKRLRGPQGRGLLIHNKLGQALRERCSLTDRGLEADDLIIDVTLLDSDELKTIIQQQDVLINA